jgi:DNA primase
MSKSKISIIKEIFGACDRSGGEYLFFCPFCNHHKKKLSVNLNKDKYKCWICDKAGPVSRLVRRFGNFLQQQDWKEITGQVEVSDFEKILYGQDQKQPEVEEKTVELPEEFVSLCNKNTSLTSVQARNYLEKRGIDKKDILRWKLGYCPDGEYGGRVVAPSFNMDGKVNFFVGRAYDGHWRKYLNPSVNKDFIFNELYIDWDSDITLVEGVFDAIKVPNSIPILGSTLREDSKLFAQILKHDPAVYVALDPDAEKKAFILIESLLKYDIEVYKVPIKPYKDVGEMTKSEFLRRKAESQLFKSTDSILLERIMGI